MPTSSQAMILRCSESTQKALFKVGFSSPLEFRAHQSPESRDSFERVQFDFSVSTSPEQSMKGYEGLFAFDPVSNSYKWQIFPVGPKDRREQWKGEANSGGDHDEGSVTEKPKKSPSFIERQTSDCTRHFTTPSVSKLDNRELVRTSAYPPDMEIIDDDTYRRLEELGFRRRTPRLQNRFFNGVRQIISPSNRRPQRCVSDAQTSTEPVSMLTINNLDDETVPEPKPLTFNKNRFSPMGCFTGDPTRKRAVVPKRKSLLDQVKESVNWSNRVMTTSHPRPVSALARYNVVCFSLREGHALSHQEVKDLIETQIQCKVQSVQYDALSVRTGDAEVLDRWLVGLKSYGHCEKAVERGLSVNGDRVIIRSWEDIVREENMYSAADDSWRYPCSYRLQSEKHTRALRKFLQEN